MKKWYRETEEEAATEAEAKDGTRKRRKPGNGVMVVIYVVFFPLALDSTLVYAKHNFNLKVT